LIIVVKKNYLFNKIEQSTKFDTGKTIRNNELDVILDDYEEKDFNIYVVYQHRQHLTFKNPHNNGPNRPIFSAKFIARNSSANQLVLA